MQKVIPRITAPQTSGRVGHPPAQDAPEWSEREHRTTNAAPTSSTPFSHEAHLQHALAVACPTNAGLALFPTVQRLSARMTDHRKVSRSKTFPRNNYGVMGALITFMDDTNQESRDALSPNPRHHASESAIHHKHLQRRPGREGQEPNSTMLC